MSEELIKELNVTSQMVKDVLSTYSETRNDDSRLQWQIGRTFFDLQLSWEEFSKLPSMETIRRMRQKFQQEGHFLPTDIEVVNKRKKKQASMRVLMPQIRVENGELNLPDSYVPTDA